MTIMKTNTYTQFKSFIKANCIDIREGYHYPKYMDDEAHLIYTAWYMFKHNLNKKQVEEYIDKDIEASKKKFSSHGINFNISILKPDAKPAGTLYNGWPYYNKDSYEFQISGCYGGGAWLSITNAKWKENVMKFYQYWDDKRTEELIKLEESQDKSKLTSFVKKCIKSFTS